MPLQQQTYQPLPPDAVSTLYVEGLPLDATEREVSHIFRPMPGYQSLRIMPKESKQHPSRYAFLAAVINQRCNPLTRLIVAGRSTCASSNSITSIKLPQPCITFRYLSLS